MHERIETLGKQIGQELGDLVLRRCAEADIPDGLRSTLARVVARTVSLSVLNSLDVAQACSWFGIEDARAKARE